MTTNCFFEKILKIDQYLAILTKKIRKKTQIKKSGMKEETLLPPLKKLKGL